MPNWFADALAWITDYWMWLVAGFALIADIIGAIEMAGAAYSKGYSRVKYFLICFFFTLLGYLIVIALPDVETAERDEELLETLHRISGKMNRTNSLLKKLNASPKSRLPEAVRKLAVPTTPVSRTRDATPGQGVEFAAPAKQPAPAKKPEPKAVETASEAPAVPEEPAKEPAEAPAEVLSVANSAPVSAALSAQAILETALQFETDTGLVSYIRRKYSKADEETQAKLEPLMHISDEGLRAAAEKLHKQF